MDAFILLQVGREPDVQRIPAVSSVLVRHSPVFHAMLRGPMSARPGSVIPIEDVDGRAFDILLKLVCNTVFGCPASPYSPCSSQKKRERSKN